MADRHNQFRSSNSIRNLVELWDQATLGLRDDVIAETIDGFIADLQNSTVEVNQQQQTLNLPATPITVEFVSSNVADVQPLQVEYIDINGDFVTSIVTLTGTTPVQLPNVFRMLFARNAGGFTVFINDGSLTIPSEGPIQGTVYCYKQGSTPGADGDTFLMITPTLDLGNGANAEIRGQRSYGSHYSIPKGYSGYVRVVQPWVGRNDDIKLSVQAKPKTGEWSTEIPLSGVNQISSAGENWRYIPEEFDLRVIGQESGGAGTVPVLLQYQLLLISNGPLS